MGDPIEAALLSAIALLERNQAIPSETLTVICEAEGENAELFRRRQRSAFKPTSNRRRLTAILYLQAIVARRSSP